MTIWPSPREQHADAQQRARVDHAFRTIRYHADDSLARRMGYQDGFVNGFTSGVIVIAVLVGITVFLVSRLA